jgi:hypothetical protein
MSAGTRLSPTAAAVTAALDLLQSDTATGLAANYAGVCGASEATCQYGARFATRVVVTLHGTPCAASAAIIAQSCATLENVAGAEDLSVNAAAVCGLAAETIAYQSTQQVWRDKSTRSPPCRW